MNSLIKAQLEMVKRAALPDYDENTTEIVIHKGQHCSECLFEKGSCYLIKLENYLLHPSETFTLRANWNNNQIPRDTYMKCEVQQVMGKMIRIQGIGFDYIQKKDLNSVWSGWLPVKSITIVSRL